MELRNKKHLLIFEEKIKYTVLKCSVFMWIAGLNITDYILLKACPILIHDNIYFKILNLIFFYTIVLSFLQ